MIGLSTSQAQAHTHPVDCVFGATRGSPSVAHARPHRHPSLPNYYLSVPVTAFAREAPPTPSRQPAELPSASRGTSPSTRTAGLVASATGPAQPQVEAFRHPEGAVDGSGRSRSGAPANEWSALRGEASSSEPAASAETSMEQQSAGGGGAWAVAALQAGVQARVVVRRPQVLQEKIEAMRRAGPSKIQVSASPSFGAPQRSALTWSVSTRNSIPNGQHVKSLTLSLSKLA